MTTILEILAIIAITIGTAFTVIGVIGFHRLPDVYAAARNRESRRVRRGIAVECNCAGYVRRME